MVSINTFTSRFFNVVIFFLLAGAQLQSQTIDWKDYSDVTRVFEINNKEAIKLLKKHPNDDELMKMLHTPVASFVKVWDTSPHQGHFIHAKIIKNKVCYDYVPIIPFQVFLFNTYGALTIQVIDAQGKIRNNAKVKIVGRWSFFNTTIPFDKESQTYRMNDVSDVANRVLIVELDHFRAVFDLRIHMANAWNVNQHSNLPLPEFYSYLITDKNKYKPGETVRFKSYALSGDKLPIRNNLQVWLITGNNRNKMIGELAPYRPGGFSGEIMLHDSLELKLDQFYYIQLRNNQKRIAAMTCFKYEDYELHNNRLEVKLQDRQQYFRNDNQLEIKVIDANGLMLQDMKADICVKRIDVGHIYTDVYMLPDTILYRRLDLDNLNPTTFTIPASLFGKANCTYAVEVVVLTDDNQRMTSRKVVNYFHSHKKITYQTTNDTIQFEYCELGENKNVKAKLRYGNEKEEKTIDLPYKEPFNQSLSSYHFEVIDSDYKASIFNSMIEPKLDLTGGIVADSFNVSLVNPLKLELSWYIYQGNKLLKKGLGKEFDFKFSNIDLDVTHYVELFYLMGDEEQAFRRSFVPKTDYLNVDVDLPERIYPGQKMDATITVKNNLNNPVKDVDLTAFAVNTLLNYDIPDLRYYGTPPRTREQRSTYSVNNRSFKTFTVPLDYKYWNKQVGLDTLKYYQFTYPENKTFIHKVNTPDSTMQFAPYVMKNGSAVNIYVIEVNSMPVYFSWTGQPQAYSFLIHGEKHKNITLRLPDRVLIFDSLYFEKGKKTIISVDMDHLPANVREMKINNKDQYNRHVFTAKEKQTFTHYISSLPFDGMHTYLTQDGFRYHIAHDYLTRRKSHILVGPIPELKSRYNDGIEYKHEGGFRYQFDKNVVYKYPETVYPSFLEFSINNNFNRLNQFALTPGVFNTLIDEYQMKLNRWFPRNIYISQSKMNITFTLPIDTDSIGVHKLLLRDRETMKMYIPDTFESRVQKYTEIPQGMYDAILLYRNGKYLKFDSIPLMWNTYIAVDMNYATLHESDSLSTIWHFLQEQTAEIETPKSTTTYITSLPKSHQQPINSVSGCVYDNMGNPLLGVVVRIKNTKYGTITDNEGCFEINLINPEEILEFNYLGYESKELYVASRSRISVTLEESYQLLEEVVILGYGTRQKKTMGIAMSKGYTSQFQMDAISSPEIFEDTDNDDLETEDAEDQLYSELLQLNGLRTKFSDVGFWEPRLYTDKNGQARFSVTFPDNITKWETVIYAMNSKLKTGTARKSIKSYKPLMAELKTPQFLVAGDSSYFAASIRNYTKDQEIAGRIVFASDQDTLMNKQINFANVHYDKLHVTASETDTLSTTYFFTRDDGYSDGELRRIPIEPQGTQIAEGTLDFLKNGNKQDVHAGDEETIHISVSGRQLDIYMDATLDLMHYKYACNEQLASKLTGLLNYKLYKESCGEEFKNDKEIKRIIKRLIGNRNNQMLWSWWGHSSNTSFWMSAHIMRVLLMAKKEGYKVDLNLNEIEQDYVDLKPYRNVSLYDIETLNTLSEYGTKQNYAAAIALFEKEIRKREMDEDSIAKVSKNYLKKSYLTEKLLLLEIRQTQQLGYSSESIRPYLKKDALGLTYCDDGLRRSWYSGDLPATIIAYRIIKRDSTLSHLKESMQMFILNTKRTGWNTYQSASVIATIMPDLLSESATQQKPTTVRLTGKENKDISGFPYETTLSPGESLSLEKINGIPLFCSIYRVRQVTQEQESPVFEVTTSFTDIGDTLAIDNRLTAGQPVALSVKVIVKQKNAEYILIEVPIPAGCSYASKHVAYHPNEVHREYFKEKTIIFCDKLPVGEYHFRIELLPRYSGRYTMNPSKAEMMYFPVVHANNAMRQVQIDDRK